MIRRVVLLLAGVAVLLGCPSGDVVKLGAVLPLTGEWSIYGQPIKNGVELAYNELIAQGNLPHQVVRNGHLQDGIGAKQSDRLGAFLADPLPLRGGDPFRWIFRKSFQVSMKRILRYHGSPVTT